MVYCVLGVQGLPRGIDGLVVRIYKMLGNECSEREKHVVLSE